MNCTTFFLVDGVAGGGEQAERAEQAEWGAGADGCVALFGRDVIESFSFRRIMPDDQYEGETEGTTSNQKKRKGGGAGRRCCT